MRKIRIPFTKGGRLLLWSPKESPLILTSSLGCQIIRRSGKIEDYGIVSRKMITTAGVNALRDIFGNTETFFYDVANCFLHVIGTGTGEEAIGNTDVTGIGSGFIANEIGEPFTSVIDSGATWTSPSGAITSPSRGVVSVMSNSTTKTIVSTATFNWGDEERAITENGICFMICTSEENNIWKAILFDRHVFSAKNIQSGDSIRFPYTLTIQDGG